jgi:hypothetical protein
MKHVLFLMAAIGGLFTLINTTCAGPFVLSWASNTGTALSVAAGDLNGDGKPDLVCGNGSQQAVVYTNAGNGTFNYSATYNLGNNAKSVAIADVNGDGKPDLIFACNSGVVVFTNLGGGIFVSNATYATGEVPESEVQDSDFVYATDVDGDGKPDIISANDDGTITVLINNGSGAFFTVDSIHANWYGQQQNGGNIAIADINGDGRPDLIVPFNYPFGLTVYTQAPFGGGIFSSNAFYNADMGQYGPYVVAAADFNNDGRMDIATGNNDSTETVFANTGNGVLVPSQVIPQANSLLDLLALDVDGDGNTDLLAVVDNYPSYELLTEFNTGGGSFLTNSLNTNGFINTLLPNTSAIYGIAVADFNGDGKPDVVLASYNGLYVLTNDVSNEISITAPNITVSDSLPSGAVVNFTTAATNWTGTLPVTNNPPSGSTFPNGVTVVRASTAYFIKGNLTASTNTTFTVTVQNPNGPVITLLGANPLTDYVAHYSDPGATATDPTDGNLTSSIVVSGTVNGAVPGTYTLTYSVTNTLGISYTVNRTVVIIPLPAMGAASAAGGQTALFWPPGSDTNYVLQMTTNLTSPNWVNVTNSAPLRGVFVTNNLPAAYFRLQPQ